jgi:pentatricopeptide repeat domain-containing protein 1
MLREHCNPNTVTYNSLITALAQGACTTPALRLCVASTTAARAYAALLRSVLLPAGAQWQKAREVFEQMHGQGCSPDVVTYTALISAFEKGGQWRLALEVRPGLAWPPGVWGLPTCC